MGSVTVSDASSPLNLPAGGVKHRSPFDGHTPGERPNRDGQVGVRLMASTLGSVTLIGTWPSGVDALCAALGSALGVAVPAVSGATVRVDDALLARTGPEEFMLLCDHGPNRTAALRARIPAGVGSVTDLGHARCRIRVEGEHCRATLSKLFAIDLRVDAFGLEQVRLTGHPPVPGMLHRLGPDSFDLYVMSTYAFDQLHTVIDAALEYGVALQWTPSTM